MVLTPALFPCPIKERLRAWRTTLGLGPCCSKTGYLCECDGVFIYGDFEVPNREAIVAELRDRHQIPLRDAVLAALQPEALAEQGLCHLIADFALPTEDRVPEGFHIISTSPYYGCGRADQMYYLCVTSQRIGRPRFHSDGNESVVLDDVLGEIARASEPAAIAFARRMGARAEVAHVIAAPDII